MRISPLALTLILALLTAAAAIGIWALAAGHFSPPGTPEEGLNNSTASDLTNYTLMAQYMPVPPNGWAEGNGVGELVRGDPGRFSYAKSDYARPGFNATASVIIYDSGGRDMIWNSIFKTGFIYSDAGGYAKVYTYKGMPAWETAKYSDGENSYALYLGLDDRYGVAVLLKNATDGSPLMDFADRINIYGIKALKKYSSAVP